MNYQEEANQSKISKLQSSWEFPSARSSGRCKFTVKEGNTVGGVQGWSGRTIWETVGEEPTGSPHLKRSRCVQQKFLEVLTDYRS